jgi:hypothetical protein
LKDQSERAIRKSTSITFSYKPKIALEDCGEIEIVTCRAAAAQPPRLRRGGAAAAYERFCVNSVNKIGEFALF